MNFRDLPISRKLIALSLATSLTSLVAVLIAVTVYNYYSFRNDLEQEISVLASVVSNRSSAAVTFEDTELAHTNLDALRYRDTIVAACIYRLVAPTENASELSLMASYAREQHTCPQPADGTGVLSMMHSDDYIEILEPIYVESTVVGFVYIQSSLADMNQRLRNTLIVFVMIIIFSGVISFVIAAFLASRISAPLLRLGETARVIAENDDYSLRAEKLSHDEVGQVVDSFNQMLDVVEREDANLRESEEKFRLISETSKVGIFQLDTDGNTIYVNEEMALITGRSVGQILEKGWMIALHPDDRYRINDQLKHLLHSGREIALDCCLYCPDNTKKWISGHIGPLRSADNRNIGFLGTISDITEVKKAHDQLERMAFYDNLTGLANRRLFRNRLEHILMSISRTGSGVALILIDLDHFKHVNDSLGHDSGDTLLTIVAERLKQCVRYTDTVARLGGDEFAIILPYLEDAFFVSSVAKKILQALHKPVMLDDSEVSISASIGISLAPEDSDNAETLFKNADLALYRAKDEGRNNFMFYTAEMNQMLVERLALVQDLRGALDNGEFYLQYQPQFHLESQTLIGLEALVRWQHPKRGFVSPVEFIPVAEETDLIIPLGRWILQTACEQMHKLLEAGFITEHGAMTVNLSVRQLADPQLVPFIERVLRSNDLKPNQLELELTETVLMENLENTIASLNQIKALGVMLSIDDFGTGYSSLGYLKRLPVNIVKVDRSFVMDIPEDRDDMEITAAVIAMAHKLKYKVVAEGIETVEQLLFLKASDCDYGQGYYFSPPLSPGDLIEYCKQHLPSELQVKVLR